MSAFVVEDKTINKVVTKLAYDRNGDWIKRQLKDVGYDLETLEGKTKLGNDMFCLNIRAVNMRYSDKPADKFRPLNYKFSLDGNYTKIAVIKSLSCWLYQCTEGDCDESNLYKLMEKVKSSWCEDVVRNLPEYDKTDWS